MQNRKILFLSAIDFKEKSIQVIRKTPEAYYLAGWDVRYIVARDNCPTGNYSYETSLNPQGLDIHRFYWPFPFVRAILPRIPKLILTKLAGFLVILKLAFLGAREVRSHNYEVIYGYENHGVLAMHIIRLFRLGNNAVTISRFQGTFLNEMLENRQYSRLAFNLDAIIACYLKSDLTIMTNDGTQGDRAVKKIKKRNDYKLAFLVNGVDKFHFSDEEIIAIRRDLALGADPVFLSISRLVGWKRVDRNLRILHKLKTEHNISFTYIIVGEGDQRGYLEDLAAELNLTECVRFTGSVKHTEIKKYLAAADFFLSMYDSSNVGNPLLEALRAHKIIITINNGDTGSWIVHKKNGLIYGDADAALVHAPKDIAGLITSPTLQDALVSSIAETEGGKLWTWDERLKAEVEMVDALCATHNSSFRDTSRQRQP